MKLVLLAVVLAGITGPASSEDHLPEDVLEELNKTTKMQILEAVIRIDSLLSLDRPVQAIGEYKKLKGVLTRYIKDRAWAEGQNNLAAIRVGIWDTESPLMGSYTDAAAALEKSLAADPTQKPLFEILARLALDYGRALVMLAKILDEVGQSEHAENCRAVASDSQGLAKRLEAALEEY